MKGPIRISGFPSLASAALLVVLGGFWGCASAPPPLDPALAAIASRAQAIDSRRGSYEQVNGTLTNSDGRSSYTAYFAGPELEVVDESAAHASGGSTTARYYFENGNPFYVRENRAEPASELQLFFDASGRLVGSRKIVKSTLTPVAAAEGNRALRQAQVIRSDARQQLGPMYKIRFDLADIDELGLAGPPLRAVRYGFCIPSKGNAAAEVRKIDPSAAIDESGKGCAPGELRVEGSTHQPAFKRVLIGLAELPYVERIDEVARR